MSTSPAQIPHTEPWLRGTYTEIPPAGRAVLHALDLAIEDIRKWTEDLTDAEIHSEPLGLTSIAFHLRHIAGSTDRILTYAEGDQLSAEQLTALKAEATGNEPLSALLITLEAAFASADTRIRALASQDLTTPRAVGRKQFPTTLGGAMIHVADHTQRHTGQIVTTAKLLKAQR
jgi:uncharacterized damage-inducible protein DinB